MDLILGDLRADGSGPMYPPPHYSARMREFCFTHISSRYGETFYSFVNGQYPRDGGTHLSAFREGLLKAVNEYSGKPYEGEDVCEAMVGAIAIRLKNPVYASHTKHKLGNTEIWVGLVNKVRKELLQFSGPAMRLSRVEYAPRPEAASILDLTWAETPPKPRLHHGAPGDAGGGMKPRRAGLHAAGRNPTGTPELR